MADRFSRFNEDRDFQVNTGVAEDPGKVLAESGASFIPVSELFLGALLGLANRLVLLPPISQGASQLETRPHIFSPPFSYLLNPDFDLFGFGSSNPAGRYFFRRCCALGGWGPVPREYRVGLGRAWRWLGLLNPAILRALIIT
jgi:hypothetical protein